MATILAATALLNSAAPRSDVLPRGSPRPAVAFGPPVVGFATRGLKGRGLRMVSVASGPPTPSEISEKVQESIKNAEEACAGQPESGECAAAWDEVEELSAAASHKRDQLKETDPLEEFCKDNPETEYCRTYDS